MGMKLIEDQERTLISIEPGLTEAWAAAEAALPEGALMEVGNKPDGSWWANCLRKTGNDSWTGFYPLVEGQTPAAALLALAAALRSHTDG